MILLPKIGKILIGGLRRAIFPNKPIAELKGVIDAFKETVKLKEGTDTKEESMIYYCAVGLRIIIGVGGVIALANYTDLSIEDILALMKALL